ncbi:MAG: hypothetical protein Q6362_011250 [Candidatus Wukongarchaeota archaeon]|nr:hypothetical protein [Candidatus Wukongarchaeota archaeon]MDO8129985.1 hypothetical protein [Candidatus Wukongarchaeota archaeon]
MATFIVQKAYRDLAKKKGFLVGSDSIKALDKAVEKLVTDAMARTKANGRKTIKAQDI